MDMDETVQEMEVKRVYNEIVGDLISRLTRKVKFSKGTLTVVLASAALKQELTMRRSSLTDRINDALGHVVVTKIIFV